MIMVPFCLRIHTKLEKLKEGVTNCMSHQYGNSKFEVDTCYGRRLVVDLVERSCTCRKWELIGISCEHVVISIQKSIQKLEAYVDDSYKEKKLLQKHTPLQLTLSQVSNGCLKKVMLLLVPQSTHHKLVDPKPKGKELLMNLLASTKLA